MGWIFASNPVLVLFKFPKESRREHTWCSVFQRFLMTGARGPGFHCEPPGAALGAGLSERYPAGPRGSLDGTPGSQAWGSGAQSAPPHALCQRTGFPGPPPQSMLAPAALVRPRGASLSHRAFEASSAPSTERDQVRGPRAKPPASYIADAIFLFCCSSLKVRTVLKIEMSKLNIDAA